MSFPISAKFIISRFIKNYLIVNKFQMNWPDINHKLLEEGI